MVDGMGFGEEWWCVCAISDVSEEVGVLGRVEKEIQYLYLSTLLGRWLL